MNEHSFQRRQELLDARDAAWALADCLEVIGETEERARVVLIARRLTDKLADAVVLDDLSPKL